MKSETQNWLTLATIDYEDSLYLFQASRHPNAVYLLCQAIEKLLKAAQVEVAGQVPKRVHDLKYLAEQSGLTFSPEQRRLLADLTTHYKRVRYRDLSQAHYNTKSKVEAIMTSGQTIYVWILNILKNH